MKHQANETGHHQAASMAPAVVPLPMPPRTPGEPTGDVPMVAPMVYVREVTKWEYEVVMRQLADNSVMTAPELNALGAQGWELMGIVATSHQTFYYFKRVATAEH